MTQGGCRVAALLAMTVLWASRRRCIQRVIANEVKQSPGGINIQEIATAYGLAMTVLYGPRDGEDLKESTPPTPVTPEYPHSQAAR